eukprot:TRINITY_DN15533_c0_g1_i1.p1 TRINITY_DN15533_c0_g1~~TRINITY_DN15533_c0_g1_i1.p1  ORF type:complete len:113 (+),score=23.13 TRINITY_DN15533_c0_g1_i1:57-395(+)
MACRAIAKYAYIGSPLDPNSVSMHVDEELLVLSNSPDGSWALIKLHDGKEGWVPTMCLTLEAPTAAAAASPASSPKASAAPASQPAVIVTHPDLMDSHSKSEVTRQITGGVY